jgi:hypothetical protein
LVTAVSTWDAKSRRYQDLGAILRDAMLTWHRRDRRAVRQQLKHAEDRSLTTSMILWSTRTLRVKRAPRDSPTSLETFHRLVSTTNGATTSPTAHRSL